MSEEKFYDFIAGCPGEGCENKQPNIRWVHTICKGEEEINADADIRCKNCKYQNSIMNMRFACKEHDNEFRKPDYTKLAWALSTALVVAKSKGDKAWAKKFNSKLLTMVQEMEE